MNGDRQKTQRRIGQRVGSQQSAPIDVDAQAKHKSCANANAQRLVDGPKYQDQRQQIRHPGKAAPATHARRHVQQQRRQQAAPDKERLGGQQQLLTVGHDHAT